MKKFALLTLFSTGLLLVAPFANFADEATVSADVTTLADDVTDPFSNRSDRPCRLNRTNQSDGPDRPHGAI